MNTVVWLITIIALITTLTITAIVAWKRTRPTNPAITVKPFVKCDPNLEKDLSIDDVMHHLKLTNLK